jgi:hypothetical protein
MGGLAMRVLIPLALLAITGLSLAAGDEPEPKIRNPAARSAITSYEAACRTADELAKRTKADAAAKCRAQLEQAKAAVMKTAGPDALAEANAIDQVIHQTNADRPTSFQDRIAGTRWGWGDAKLGDKAIVVFNSDFTLSAGWHDKGTLWVATGKNRVRAKVGASPVISVIVFDDALTKGTATGDDGTTRELTRLK